MKIKLDRYKLFVNKNLRNYEPNFSIRSGGTFIFNIGFSRYLKEKYKTPHVQISYDEKSNSIMFEFMGNKTKESFKLFITKRYENKTPTGYEGNLGFSCKSFFDFFGIDTNSAAIKRTKIKLFRYEKSENKNHENTWFAYFK